MAAEGNLGRSGRRLLRGTPRSRNRSNTRVIAATSVMRFVDARNAMLLTALGEVVVVLVDHIEQRLIKGTAAPDR